MRKAIAILGCMLVALASGCSTVSNAPPGTTGPEAEPAAVARPTLDLTTASIEFAMEITGDPEPLTQIPGIALDAEGNLLVIDGENDRIQRYDRDGRLLSTWGERGEGDGQFQFLCQGYCFPWSLGGLALDGDANIYIADAWNARIQKFDSEGNHLLKWGSYGTADGQFLQPVGVAVDDEGNVYVTDSVRGNVQKFDSEGQFLVALPNMSLGDFGWLSPAVDEQGNVYIPNDHAAEVRKLNTEGELLMTFGKRGRGDGEFVRPSAVALDRQGNVYVTDKNRHCVQKFDREGNFLVQWGSQGDEPGQFREPTGLAVDGDGTVYVAEWGGERIQVFSQR